MSECPVLAMVHPQWFTCDNLLAIATRNTENRMRIDLDIKGSQVKDSACWNFCYKQLQAIRMSNRKSIASKVLATSVQGLKPDSHRKIVKDYRPKTGRDHETLRESVQNLLKIV